MRRDATPDPALFSSGSDERGAEEIEALAARLGRCSLFAGLEAIRLQKLASITCSIGVDAGVELIRQGDYGDTLYLVDEGTVEVRVVDEEGLERVAARIDHGADDAGGRPAQNAVGEMCLLDLEPRSATVATLTPCRLLELHRDDLYWLFGEDRGLQLHVIVAIARLISWRLRSPSPSEPIGA